MKPDFTPRLRALMSHEAQRANPVEHLDAIGNARHIVDAIAVALALLADRHAEGLIETDRIVGLAMLANEINCCAHGHAARLCEMAQGSGQRGGVRS